MPENKLIYLTDDERKNEINLVRINDAIKSASGEIDGYAQAKYPVPFNPIPEIITKYCVDIALYNLFSRRGFDESSADSIIAKRYNAAIKFLENLAKGVVTIGVTTPKPDTEIMFTSNKRVFSRESMKGF